MGMVARIADGLRNIASGLGTASDKRSASAYCLSILTPHQIDAAYRSSWLMRKIVDVPASDMTRERRDWQAEAKEIEKLEAEEKRLKLWEKVSEALILGRLGGGAIIMGIGNEDPAFPINANSLKPGALRYLHVVSRHRLTLGEMVMDPADDLFGQPKHFQLSGLRNQVMIHPSRVIVFKGAPVPDLGIAATSDQAFWGDSVIQSVMEAVQNADTATGGFASLIHEAKVDTVAIPGLIDIVATPEGENALIKRIEIANTFKSAWNTRIIDGGSDGTDGEDWDTRQITWTGMPEVMNSFMGFVAGAADIPATRLLGRSPQGMNATGDSDLTNYYDGITARQDRGLRPQLEQIDSVLIPSAGVAVQDDRKVWFEFPPLTTPTEKEEADTFNVSMDAVTKLLNTGLVPDVAMSKGVQNFMSERGYLPGLDAALAEISEDERFGLVGEGDNDEDPSKLTEGGDPNLIGGGSEDRPASRAANDAAPRSLYVHRKLLNAAEFIAWAKGQGFDTTTPADDLHVTITFSRTPVDWMKMGDNWSDNGKGGITVPAGGARIVEPLGDKGAVVLLFASSSLSWRHEEIIRNGASHDFDEYQPHVTITYQKPDGLDLSKVEPFRGKLEFGPEIFSEIVDDWEKGVVEK
jgi:phage-related protein (TIGR01555 family)